jgi:very-short-patch-repair endonuclease
MTSPPLVPLSTLWRGGLGGEVEIDMSYTQVPGYIFNLCRKLRQKQTNAEKLLWKRLRRKHLNGLKFRRQHPIGRYIADFFCPEARLAIELDGGIHQFKDQKEYDKARQEIIEVREIRVLRVKNEEIEQSIESVVRKILSFTSPP